MKKTALITGASSGIGRELARIHAERGGNLVIIARRHANLIELKKELEKKYAVKITVIAKDLSQPSAPQEIYNEVKKAGIEIDFLINNAGFGGLGKFYQRSWEQDLAMIQVNIVALTNLCRLFLPEFVKRNHGKILNVSSTASLVPGGPLQAVYYATKAFVTSFSNALFEELANTKITVTALLPGATATEFKKVANLTKTKLFQKTASARHVAEEGYEGMLRGKLNIIAGLTFFHKFMLFTVPFSPRKNVLQTIRKMQEVPN